jgi:hypothetical protein
MSQNTPPNPREPQSSIEIIPPGEETREPSRIWIMNGSHSVKIVRLGPLGSLFMAVAIGLILLLGLAFFASAFLILVPVAALLAGAAYLSGKLGNPFKRLR